MMRTTGIMVNNSVVKAETKEHLQLSISLSVSFQCHVGRQKILGHSLSVSMPNTQHRLQMSQFKACVIHRKRLHQARVC